MVAALCFAPRQRFLEALEICPLFGTYAVSNGGQILTLGLSAGGELVGRQAELGDVFGQRFLAHQCSGDLTSCG